MSHYAESHLGPLFDNTKATSKAESKQEGRAARNAARPSSASLSRQCTEVLDVVRTAGPNGATSSDISTALGLPKNAFSGRITELVEAGLLFRKAGVRRGRDSVLFAKGYC